MTVRIDHPFDARWELPDPGTNSREVRTQLLHTYLLNSGMELGHDIGDFYVDNFSGEENGEFWQVRSSKR
jgi:hypothetical protein